MMSKLLRVCWVDITTPLAALLNILILFLDSALPMCTTNCSHFLNCESRQGMYHCNCQAGFTGPQCDINVDECSSSPCVHGICEDGINQYDCVCSKGYWGNNCEKKINDKGGVFLRPVYVTLDNIFLQLVLRLVSEFEFWLVHCAVRFAVIGHNKYLVWHYNLLNEINVFVERPHTGGSVGWALGCYAEVVSSTKDGPTLRVLK